VGENSAALWKKKYNYIYIYITTNLLTFGSLWCRVGCERKPVFFRMCVRVCVCGVMPLCATRAISDSKLKLINMDVKIGLTNVQISGFSIIHLAAYI